MKLLHIYLDVTMRLENNEVRILTSFGAGDLGTEVDFLHSVMWVTKVTF